MRLGLFLLTFCFYLTADIGNLANHPNLKLWLSASTLTLNDGDSVEIWPDKSEKQNDYVQTLSSRQPSYVANAINAKPAVHFMGHHFRGPDRKVFAHVADFNVFVVLERMQSGSYQTLYGSGNSDHHLIGFQGDNLIFYSSSGISPTSHRSSKVAPLKKPQIIEYRKQVFTLEFQLNGELYGRGDFDPPSSKISAGASYLGGDGGENFHGYLAEFIAFDTALSLEDRQTLRCHLASEYAIAVKGC